jgi:glutamine amidotransferase
MCRFALYLGSDLTVSRLVTEPSNSIIHQSFHNLERAEPSNGDGFGLAWYVPELSEEPALFRSISPAWNNQNLLQLARVTRSRAILAHIRAASPGLPVTELNCHPFSWGRYAFMHNGAIGGFQRLRRRMLAGLSDTAFEHVAGSTDSEHLFGFFIDQMLQHPGDGGVEPMAQALAKAIADVEELRREAGIEQPSQLNLAVTDGERAVVSRFVSAGAEEEAPSLYYHVGRRYVCEDGVCRMVDPDGSHQAVIVSSERLSEDPGWDAVPANHLVVVDGNLTAELRPLGAGKRRSG